MKKRSLTAADVFAIRNSMKQTNELAKEYGVDSSTISEARNCVTYRWVVDVSSEPPKPKKSMGIERAMELIKAGHEFDSSPPRSFMIALRNLRTKGYDIRRVVRYEIID